MKTYFILMMLLTVSFFGVRIALTESIKKYFGIRTFAAVGIILAAGFALHNAFVYMLLSGIVLFVAATTRRDALCLFTVLITMIPNVGQFFVVGGLYLTYLPAAVVLSVAALIACFARKGPYTKEGLSFEDALVIVLVICFGFAAQRLGTFTGIQRTFVTILLEMGFPYYLYRRFLNDTADLSDIIGAIAGCAMILAVVALCEARTHWAIYDTIFENFSSGFFISHNASMRAGLLRAPASFGDSTAFALFEVIGILAVITSRSRFRNDALWIGSIVLTILGLTSGQSRGADLGLIFGLFMLMVVRRRYALATAVVGGGAAIVSLLLALARVSPLVAAVVGFNPHSVADQDYRQTLLRRGLQVGMEHPVFGYDMTHILIEMGDITQGQGFVDLVNTYLTIFLNSGLFGLGLFVIFIAIILRRLFVGGLSVDGTDISMSARNFIFSALSSLLFMLTFTSFVHELNYFWLILLLAGCRAVRAPYSHLSMIPLRQGAIFSLPADFNELPLTLTNEIKYPLIVN